MLAIFLLSWLCVCDGDAEALCKDETCRQRDPNSNIKVAFVHHSMDVGGVERQIRLICASADKNQVKFEILVFLGRGEWAEHLEQSGVPVHLFQVWKSRTELARDHESEMTRLIDYIKSFDLVHAWYGGGAMGTFHTFPSLVARR
jgi:hypothetical protein